MKAYKGFHPDMTCRDFQYEEGKSYETARAAVCEEGFHACEYPLDCFGYYEPGKAVYHEVELDGDMDRSSDDSKVAATKIKIGARLSIADMVKAALDFTFSRTKPEAKADEVCGCAQTKKDQSASAATGDRSASAATGYRSASAATGDRSASAATGLGAVSVATGEDGMSTAGSATALAVSWGIDGKAKGVMGAYIALAEWRWMDDNLVLRNVRLAKIDGKKFKPDTWYTFRDGKIVEVEP